MFQFSMMFNDGCCAFAASRAFRSSVIFYELSNTFGWNRFVIWLPPVKKQGNNKARVFTHSIAVLVDLHAVEYAH